MPICNEWDRREEKTMLYSRRTGRRIEILEEDESGTYFVWEDFPEEVAFWSKKCDETFSEYFIATPPASL